MLAEILTRTALTLHLSVDMFVYVGGCYCGRVGVYNLEY